MRCFSLITALLKMHVFKIKKVEVDGEVRAPFGAGLNNYDVMEKVVVTAKPNERVSQWSPLLNLVKKLPEKDTLPGGTLFFIGLANLDPAKSIGTCRVTVCLLLCIGHKPDVAHTTKHARGLLTPQ